MNVRPISVLLTNINRFTITAEIQGADRLVVHDPRCRSKGDESQEVVPKPYPHAQGRTQHSFHMRHRHHISSFTVYNTFCFLSPLNIALTFADTGRFAFRRRRYCVKKGEGLPPMRAKLFAPNSSACLQS